MKRDATIYGLFDAEGICHYVGQTITPIRRKVAHRRAFPDYCFRTIKKIPRNDRYESERETISEFRARGECRLNFSGTQYGSVSVTLNVNSEQKYWLRRMGRASGQGVAAVVRCLIDKAMAGQLQIDKRSICVHEAQRRGLDIVTPEPKRPRGRPRCIIPPEFAATKEGQRWLRAQEGYERRKAAKLAHAIPALAHPRPQLEAAAA